MSVTDELLEGREQQGARIKGAELGLKDFPEDGDQVPEGLVIGNVGLQRCSKPVYFG